MKQTAVEWLINELENEATLNHSYAQTHKAITLDLYTFNELFTKAKQMEKQQIEDAHYGGQITTSDYGAYSGYAEQYYKQTYGE